MDRNLLDFSVGIEIGLILVWGPKLTWFLCGGLKLNSFLCAGRKLLVSSVEIDWLGFHVCSKLSCFFVCGPK